MKKEKKLLEAIGDIDEKFVLEASPEIADTEVIINSIPTETTSASGSKSQESETYSHSSHETITADDPEPQDNIIYMQKKRDYKSLGVIAAAAVIIIGIGAYMTILKGNESTMAPTVLEEAANVDGEADSAVNSNAFTGSADAYSPETFAENRAASDESADALQDAEVKTKKAIPEDASKEGAAPDAGSEAFTSMIANPWLDSDSLKEAEDDAGFEITIPDTYEGATQSAYRSMSGNMIEIIYKDSSDTEVFRIRKSSKTGDISGDYNVYEVEKNIDLKGLTITMKGNGDDIFTATWTKDDYSYAITIDDSQHFSIEQLKDLIGQIA